MNPAAVVTVQVVVALGMLVVLPLGLRLLDGLGAVARWWPLVGALGAASLVLPPGPLAVGLSATYAAATAVLAALGLRRAARWWRSGRSGAPLELAVLTALATPAVGAVALVAERAGVELLGFDLAILALTVPHLHYAGFAAALIAGLVHRATADGGARSAAAALTVPAGTLLVLGGYLVGDWAELVGALVLTAGLWLVGHLTWTAVRPTAPRAARPLLAVSSVVLVATMLLACWWALGEVTGWPHPTIGWMVATHGVANALGFALCGVLAWRLVTQEAL